MNKLDEVNEHFIKGVLFSASLLLSRDEPTFAEEIIRESGYSKEQFLEVQKKVGYETRKMNKLIRNSIVT